MEASDMTSVSVPETAHVRRHVLTATEISICGVGCFWKARDLVQLSISASVTQPFVQSITMAAIESGVPARDIASRRNRRFRLLKCTRKITYNQ